MRMNASAVNGTVEGKERYGLFLVRFEPFYNLISLSLWTAPSSVWEC